MEVVKPGTGALVEARAVVFRQSPYGAWFSASAACGKHGFRRIVHAGGMVIKARQLELKAMEYILRSVGEDARAGTTMVVRTTCSYAALVLERTLVDTWRVEAVKDPGLVWTVRDLSLEYGRCSVIPSPDELESMREELVTSARAGNESFSGVF